MSCRTRFMRIQWIKFYAYFNFVSDSLSLHQSIPKHQQLPTPYMYSVIYMPSAVVATVILDFLQHTMQQSALNTWLKSSSLALPLNSTVATFNTHINRKLCKSFHRLLQVCHKINMIPVYRITPVQFSTRTKFHPTPPRLT